MQKKALGRGLDSLINGGFVASVAIEPPQTPVEIRPLGSLREVTRPADGIEHLDIAAIERSRFQPRSEFDPEQLRELSDSIKQRGVMQPLLVRPLNGTG